MRNIVKMQKVLLGGVSALAIGALVGPAIAQDASSTPVETVVVTGIRASLESAQAIKQNSDQVVDSITAVDIGALPDRNVADALQRIPGVTLQRTDVGADPVRFGGTGSSVFIRGLAWTQALTNGRDVFSAVNGQSLSFSDVSADLLSGVDVYKNPNAEMIEGGIGGSIDLKTRKPFDQDGQLIAVSGDITYAMMNKRGTGSANGLYSNRWNTSIGEVGLLVSVDWQDQRNRTQGFDLSEYDCVDLTGTYAVGSTGCKSQSTTNSATGALQTVYTPNTIGERQLDWQQQRFATDIVGQWRPNDKVEVTLEVLNAVADPNDAEHLAEFYPSQSASGLANDQATYAADGTWDGGAYTNYWVENDVRVTKHHDRTTDASLNIKYNPTADWEISLDAQFVESVATVYSLTNFDAETAPGTFTVKLTNGLPTTNYVGVDNVASNYNQFAMMDHLEDNAAHAGALRLDVKHNFGEDGVSGWLKSVDFGFRGDDKLSVTRQTNYHWNSNWSGTSAALYPKSMEYFNFGSFLGSSNPLNGYFPTVASLNKTQAYANAQFGNRFGSLLDIADNCTNDVQCLAVYQGFNASTTGVDHGVGGINTVEEKTYAGYLMANFGHDTFLGYDVPVDGNIGVRIVRTEDTISAGQLVVDPVTNACAVGTQANPNTSATFTVPAGGCADWNTAQTFTGGTTNAVTDTLAAVNNSYTDVQPSFDFRAHLNDQLQARIAYSQSMVRPDFTQMANFTTVGFGFGSNYSATEGTYTGIETGMSGTAGNPHLKPMHSQNYDASLEWYFAPTGSVTFALFHKDIGNYFNAETAPLQVTNPATNVTDTFYVTETTNGQKGSLSGFEAAYQQFYDSLPGVWGGLGVQANYTKLYNSGGANTAYNVFQTTGVTNSELSNLPMEGMSNDTYNLALLYSKYGIDGRLAYNWRSSFLYTTSASNVKQPVWSEAYGQLDASVLYNFMANYKIGIQATNLLNTKTYLDIGYADYHPRYTWLETDQKLSIVFRASW